MDIHRTSDLPTFPPGSDWAEPTRPPESSREADRRRTGLWVLWLSVVTFGLISYALLLGDETIYNGTNTDDVSAFDGLTTAAIVVAGILFGATPLATAIAQSVAAGRRRPATSRPPLLISLYTAACGVVTAVYWVIGAEQTATDRRVLPDALRDGELLMASPALLGLLPLAVYLAGGLFRSEERSRLAR